MWEDATISYHVCHSSSLWLIPPSHDHSAYSGIDAQGELLNQEKRREKEARFDQSSRIWEVQMEKLRILVRTP